MSRGGALVTGSATGIGRGIALALAREGYDVAVHYRRSGAEAEATRSEIEALGVKAITFQADVTESGAPAMLVQEAHARLGSLAALVNNVGNYVYGPLDELSTEE